MNLHVLSGELIWGLVFIRALKTALYNTIEIAKKDYAENDTPKLPTWNVSRAPLAYPLFHIPPFSTKIPAANDETE